MSEETLNTNEQSSAQELINAIAELQAQIAALKQAEPTVTIKEITVDKSVPKNKRRVKADPTRTYTFGGAPLKMDGKVPQQQLDLANLCAKYSPAQVGEPDLFNLLEEHQAEYESLRTSVQHVTWLFCYYRGLGRTAKQAGFVARGFLTFKNS